MRRNIAMREDSCVLTGKISEERADAEIWRELGNSVSASESMRVVLSERAVNYRTGDVCQNQLTGSFYFLEKFLQKDTKFLVLCHSMTIVTNRGGRFQKATLHFTRIYVTPEALSKPLVFSKNQKSLIYFVS